MFWLNKNKNKGTDKCTKPASKELRVIEGERTTVSKSQRDSLKIREVALANARAAREQIGGETLDKIATAMAKKQQSATEQAKVRIRSADSGRVVDEILALLDER